MYHITLKSKNQKTGMIPVSVSPKSTCPASCPLNGNGCYAEGGPLAIHWKHVSEGRRGTPWREFLATIRRLPVGQIWRHNAAGDLPGHGDHINGGQLQALAAANTGRRGFTFTHKPPTPSNRRAVAMANKAGFTVNLSADTVAEADQLHALGIGPVVVVVPEATAPVTYTPQGRKIVVCPAQQREDITCKDCALCAVSTRSVIVGFRAHGSSKRKVEAVCEGGAK